MTRFGSGTCTVLFVLWSKVARLRINLEREKKWVFGSLLLLDKQLSSLYSVLKDSSEQ